ncbi:MAG: hypothetical protein JSW58_14795 [Candidatus Latescibacterota bacterium]|nr:MAG: hypothetical protein JSW58_14795 [Candidatus Latescibacterota bacterium]
MRLTKLVVLSLVTVVVAILATPAVSGEGSGLARLGYIYTDEMGNVAVNQETFNIYEGGNFSIEDFLYTTDSGLRFRADLRAITLENRNLTLSAAKSKLFSISAYGNKYQRIYESAGKDATKREMLGGRVSVSPVRYVKFFGGFDRTNKSGENRLVFDGTTDPVVLTSDYAHRSFDIGAEGFYRGTNLRVEYKTLEFEDETGALNDREADVVRLSGTSPVPRLKWIVLSGGYNYRQDEVGENGVELGTNLGWGAARVYFPRQFTVDYRFVFGRTLHNGTNIETDNVFNTVAVSKRWNRHGGVRVGYESRIADDLIDRSESNGFLFNGWYNYANRLFVRGSAGIRNEDVVTGSTLLGDEDFTRYQLTVKLADKRLGDISARYQGRTRTRDDLGTRVDYNGFSAQLNLSREKYGQLSVSYSYYLGEFENLVDDFEFSDHVLTGMVTPVSYKSVTVKAGCTFYRSRRDLDIEKFSLNLGVRYDLPRDFGVEARYWAFNYDDFQVADDFYSANMVELDLLKDFSL